MQPRSPVSFLPLFLFAVMAIGLLGAIRHSGGGEAGKFATHTGEPAPATDLPLFDDAGLHFNSKDWQGRAYIVNFFASWCQPCHAEHLGLLMLARDHIPLIGIAYKDGSARIGHFLETEGNPFIAVAADTNGRTGIDWGITGLPETYVIDRTGHIRLHIAGPLSEDDLRRRILPLWRQVSE